MPSRPSFKETFKLYLDARLLRIFGLGVASGFPWVMIGSAMTAWLAEEGYLAPILVFSALFSSHSQSIFCGRRW